MSKEILFDRPILTKSPVNDYSFVVIALCVLGIHLLFFSWALRQRSPASNPLSRPARSFVVQTVTLHPPSTSKEEVPKQVLAEEVIEKNLVETDLVAERTIEEHQTSQHEDITTTSPIKELPAEEPIAEVKSSDVSPSAPAQPTVKKGQKKTKDPVLNAEKESTANKQENNKQDASVKTEKKSKPTSSPRGGKNPPIQDKEKLEQTKKLEAEKMALEKEKAKEVELQESKRHQQELLAKARERIAKIDQSLNKASSKGERPSVTATPTPISTLKIDNIAEGTLTLFDEKEANYREEVACRLKILLKLPEYGEVKVKLTLERSGKVAKVIIDSSESEVNRNYIQKTLPTLTFPPFGTYFGSVSEYTFSITLSSER